MSRVVVLGAGVAGHTAAAFLRKWLDRRDEVVVVSPKPDYNWIPSNIWVGVGLMKPSRGHLPARAGLRAPRHRVPAGAGGGAPPRGPRATTPPFVVIESTRPGHDGEREEIRYDFLVNATGPKLNFGATEGLGPRGPQPVGLHRRATPRHGAGPRRGGRPHEARASAQRFLVGTGHGACTCEGAAFEYIVNLEFELRAREVRDARRSGG